MIFKSEIVIVRLSLWPEVPSEVEGEKPERSSGSSGGLRRIRLTH